MLRSLLLTMLLLSVASCAKKDSTSAAGESGDPTTAAADSGQQPPNAGGKTWQQMFDAKPINRTVLGSGLTIEDLRTGEGAVCWPGSIVAIKVKGFNPNTGKEFDSSYLDAEPRIYTLKRVTIKALTEGLPGMRVGGKRRLTAPPHLAYEHHDVQNYQGEIVVPAGTTVVFEVDLVDLPEKLPEPKPQPEQPRPNAPQVKSEDLVVGTGAECTSPEQIVRLHYRGTLDDGTEFESTLQDEPVMFPLKDFLPGCQIGMQGMKVGGKRRLIVPPVLGYGKRDIKGEDGRIVIPANSTLTIEIELLDVK